jgi:hypothetical protein
MKNPSKISKVIVLIALVTVVVAGCMNRTHRWGHENATGHITEALSLNDTQSQELEVLMNEIKSSRQELCLSKRAMEAKLKKQLLDDELDAEVINGLVVEQFNRAEATITSIVSQVADFHSTLNADQKEKLLDHMNKDGGKWHKRHRTSICDEVRG